MYKDRKDHSQRNRSNDKEFNQDQVYSQKLRAGQRSYFFDVKSTRQDDDYYLVITESKKSFNREDNNYRIKRNKIFLYKEDFNKFERTLREVIEYMKKELMPNYDFTTFDRASQTDEVRENKIEGANHTAEETEG